MTNTFAINGVILQLRSLLSEKQLLESVVVGVKLKDLQVCAIECFSKICFHVVDIYYL